MRVSNEPCTDRSSNARRELAHERAFDGLAVYGECRDSEQTLCVCEPVGMAHCVPAEATTIQNQNTAAPSLLGSDRGLIWTYTANAATVSKRSAFANLSAWLIASHSNPQHFEKPEFA